MFSFYLFVPLYVTYYFFLFIFNCANLSFPISFHLFVPPYVTLLFLLPLLIFLIFYISLYFTLSSLTFSNYFNLHSFSFSSLSLFLLWLHFTNSSGQDIKLLHKTPGLVESRLYHPPPFSPGAAHALLLILHVESRRRSRSRFGSRSRGWAGSNRDGRSSGDGSRVFLFLKKQAPNTFFSFLLYLFSFLFSSR